MFAKPPLKTNPCFLGSIIITCEYIRKLGWGNKQFNSKSNTILKGPPIHLCNIMGTFIDNLGCCYSAMVIVLYLLFCHLTFL